MTALRLVDSPARGDTDPDLLDYLEWGRELRGLRPNTLRVRRDVVQRMVFRVGKPLREISEADLLAWERTSVAGRAPETRHAYISHVRALFQWAVKMQIVAVDPSGSLTQPKIAQGVPRPMPEADLHKAVESATPKIRLMILLGAFCGLRCQEIAGLHWSDLQTGDEETTLLVREGKGGKERVVPAPVVVIEAMVAHGRRRSGPMFYGRDARQIAPHSVSQSVNHHLKRQGIAATAHQLRHRYATVTYRLSKDVLMIQELLGHNSPQTTARYTAYDKSKVTEVVKALDAAWLGREELPSEPATKAETAALTSLLAERGPAQESEDSELVVEPVKQMTSLPPVPGRSRPARAFDRPVRLKVSSAENTSSKRPTVADLGLLGPRVRTPLLSEPPQR
ncbi:tyrosine-type recombinase/integrase [Modestobacter lapidis]|nr:tyrosine-type recombinase/integrase [Modestobacter lapidis]